MQEEKQEYRTEINKLLERCEDIGLLDLIYKLLCKAEARAPQIAK